LATGSCPASFKHVQQASDDQPYDQPDPEVATVDAAPTRALCALTPISAAAALSA